MACGFKKLRQYSGGTVVCVAVQISDQPRVSIYGTMNCKAPSKMVNTKTKQMLLVHKQVTITVRNRIIKKLITTQKRPMKWLEGVMTIQC